MSDTPDHSAQMRALAERLTRSLGQLGQLGMPEIGTSERQTVLSGRGFKLLRYGSGTARDRGCPVLIAYALVNRPWVLDLEPERSTIARLLEAGLDVFLIEWTDPGPDDHDTGLADYICGMLDQCVDAACAVRNENAINLLGVCQGGTFSLCYTALFPHKVRNLVTMVTPVDFHTKDNLLSHWVRGVDLDRLVGCYGNVPGSLLNALFIALQPFRLGGKKYLDLADLANDPERLHTFARMERWIADSPDQAGRAFAEFIGTLYQRNSLVKDQMVLDEKLVRLSAVRCPVLNVYALADHLVPAAASRALAQHVGSSDYRELAFDGGHIGIYVSRHAQQQIPPEIAAWLQARQ
mgnify:FL=1|jgi:polyhydroxyalkanoate synthase